jgi:hypothetical protein
VGRFEGRGISRRGDGRSSFAATQHKDMYPPPPGPGDTEAGDTVPLKHWFSGQCIHGGEGDVGSRNAWIMP